MLARLNKRIASIVLTFERCQQGSGPSVSSVWPFWVQRYAHLSPHGRLCPSGQALLAFRWFQPPSFYSIRCLKNLIAIPRNILVCGKEVSAASGLRAKVAPRSSLPSFLASDTGAISVVQFVHISGPTYHSNPFLGCDGNMGVRNKINYRARQNELIQGISGCSFKNPDRCLAQTTSSNIKVAAPFRNLGRSHEISCKAVLIEEEP